MCIPNHVSVYEPFERNQLNFLSILSRFTQDIQGERLTNVDLYYQPLPNPTIASVNLMFSLIIIFVGGYINNGVLNFVNRETCLVKDILRVFLYFQMVYWPGAVILQGSTEFVYPIGSIIGSWYCVLEYFWLVFGMTFILFHSFIVGLMRYVFVVHNEKVIRFEKESVKRMFFWAAILIPCAITIWGFTNQRKVSAVSSLNKCNGIHHEVFLIENSFESTAKRNFCFLETYDEENSFEILKRISCTLHSIVYAILGFNVLEGLFYWRIVRHSNQ